MLIESVTFHGISLDNKRNEFAFDAVEISLKIVILGIVRYTLQFSRSKKSCKAIDMELLRPLCGMNGSQNEIWVGCMSVLVNILILSLAPIGLLFSPNINQSAMLNSKLVSVVFIKSSIFLPLFSSLFHSNTGKQLPFKGKVDIL